MPTTVPLPKRGRWSKLTACQINDFRPGVDRVIRDPQGRAWVTDDQGCYAPIEVAGDKPPPGYSDTLKSLTQEKLWRIYWSILATPYLSEQGKEERLELIRPLLSFTVEVLLRGTSYGLFDRRPCSSVQSSSVSH